MTCIDDMLYILVFIACICSLIAISTIALKKSKSNAVTIVLSIIGLIAGFVALAINAPRATDQLGFDYLGFIVAILAIFATLLLGLQLYNVFKLKEDADDVHKAKQRIDNYTRQMEEFTKRSEALSQTLEQLSQKTSNIEEEIKTLNDIASDLEEKSDRAVYIANDGPCDDK